MFGKLGFVQMLDRLAGRLDLPSVAEIQRDDTAYQMASSPSAGDIHSGAFLIGSRAARLFSCLSFSSSLIRY